MNDRCKRFSAYVMYVSRKHHRKQIIYVIENWFFPTCSMFSCSLQFNAGRTKYRRNCILFRLQFEYDFRFSSDNLRLVCPKSEWFLRVNMILNKNSYCNDEMQENRVVNVCIFTLQWKPTTGSSWFITLNGLRYAINLKSLFETHVPQTNSPLFKSI